MKIVEQKASVYLEPNPYKKVERAGRTCYQSKMSNDEESQIRFIKNALKNKHYSIFEHLVFCFIFPKACDGNFYHLKKILQTAENNPNFSATVNEEKNRSIISINFRFLMEAYHTEKLLYPLVEAIYRDYPHLFLDEIKDENGNVKKLNLAKCMTSDEFLLKNYKDLSQEEKEQHTYFSCILTTDRGVMAELTRHRLNAFSVSSTRYINFDKRFPSLPVIEQVEELPEEAIKLLEKIEETYAHMIGTGVKPEIARGILPNVLWTEIFTTANLKQWNHIFELRTAKGAHPQIRKLMENLNLAIYLMCATIEKTANE